MRRVELRLDVRVREDNEVKRPRRLRFFSREVRQRHGRARRGHRCQEFSAVQGHLAFVFWNSASIHDGNTPILVPAVARSLGFLKRDGRSKRKISDFSESNGGRTLDDHSDTAGPAPQHNTSTAGKSLKLADRSASVNRDYFGQIWRRAGGAKQLRGLFAYFASRALPPQRGYGSPAAHFCSEF